MTVADMTIRITTTRAVTALVLALAYVVLTPATPAAADREHQQIMADLRMLQEQTQQLQALMTDLGEALKAVNSRIEDQTSLERKAFADGKVQMDNMSGDLRVVREKVDETNVRLGTITQELESLRQAIPEPGAVPQMRRQRTDATRTAPGAAPPGGRLAAATAAATPPANRRRAAAAALRQLVRATTRRATTRSRSQGFESYLRTFSEEHACARGAALCRRIARVAEERHGRRRRLRSRHRQLSGLCIGADGVLQARHGLRAARRTRPRAGNRTKPSIKQFPDTQQATLAKQRLE